MKTLVCKKDFKSSFFNLENTVTHAKEGDVVILTNQDFTYSYFINKRTDLKFWLPTVAMETFFEEVK